MLDIKFVRENPDLVKENIKKKFQDAKLPLVDEVLELDKALRDARVKGDELRAERNSKSQEVGNLMREKKIDEANAIKAKVSEINKELEDIEAKEADLSAKIKEKMMVIPNIIDASVPIGKDDSENVENEKFGEPVVPNFEVPYHADIMAR